MLVAVESAGLIWLDKVYFRSDSHISVSRLNSGTSSRQSEPKVNIPAGATNVQYSYDGGYLSYVLADKLIVVDTDKGTQNTVPDVSGESMKIAQYAWVYGRNRIILAEQNTGGSSKNYVRFYYYVPTDTSQIQEMDNTLNNQRVSIDLNRLKNLSGSTATVTDLDFSTVYSTVYARIRDKNGRSVIYMLNIDNQLDTVDTATDTIGKVVTDQQDTGLLYEDSKTGYVYNWQPTKKSSTNKAIAVNGTKKLRLLGVDGQDTVYLAPTTGDSTSSVVTGTVSGGWKTVSLGRDTPLSRIRISLAGKIYVDDPDAKVLRNVTDSTQTEYTGTLVGLYNDGFFTRSSDSGFDSAASSSTSGKSRSSSASSSSAGNVTVTGNAFASDPVTSTAAHTASSRGTSSGSSRASSSSHTSSGVTSSRK